MSHLKMRVTSSADPSVHGQRVGLFLRPDAGMETMGEPPRRGGHYLEAWRIVHHPSGAGYQSSSNTS